MMSKNLLNSRENQKVVPFEEVASQAPFEFGDNARARAVMDEDGTPQMFAFNTTAFLDLLSAIDRKLLDELDDDTYYSKETNPAGWLIDEMESRLPVSDELAEKLEKTVNEEEWVTEEKLKESLEE